MALGLESKLQPVRGIIVTTAMIDTTTVNLTRINITVEPMDDIALIIPAIRAAAAIATKFG